MYGIGLTSRAPKGTEYCRERLQRSLYRRMKASASWKDGIKNRNRKISIILKTMPQHGQVLNKNRNTVQRNIVNFTGLIVMELFNRLGVKPKTLSEIRIDYSGDEPHTTRTINVLMPALVLHNPVFPSFYLGIVRTLVHMPNIVEIPAEGGLRAYLDQLTKDKNTYISPLSGPWERNLQLFLESYQEKNLLPKFLETKWGVYGGGRNTPSGYLDWCAKVWFRKQREEESAVRSAAALKALTGG